MNTYDVGIVGAGVAGAFAALRMAEKHKGIKSILFELGRPVGKRRRQLEGWFGCFPTGDGKIFINDIDSILELVDGRRAKPANRWFMNHLAAINKIKSIKDKLPSAAVTTQAKACGYEIKLNDYIQWKPDSIHQLSRAVADTIEAAGNVDFSFDNEVYRIFKQKSDFIVSTSRGDYRCKHIVLCVGRSGWRWVNKLYRDLGILSNDSVAKVGVRFEISAQYMKDFNRSNCSFLSDDINVGPFSWFGTVIQEDHADLVISAFRSNEDRWKSDKVSFSMIGSRECDSGCLETDRLGKLAFLLSNDRVGKEKVRTIIKKTSQLSLIPEYGWLPEAIIKLNEVIPNLISRGYFHTPDISTLTSEIVLGNNLESELDGLFVAGESAGIRGIAAAGITGAIAADSACR